MSWFAKAIYDLVKNICDDPQNSRGASTRVSVNSEIDIEDCFVLNFPNSTTSPKWEAIGASGAYKSSRPYKQSPLAPNYSRVETSSDLSLNRPVPFCQSDITEQDIISGSKTIGDLESWLNYHGYTNIHISNTDIVIENQYIKGQTVTINKLLEIKFPQFQGQPFDWDNLLTANPISSNNIFAEPFYNMNQREYITDQTAGGMLVDFLRLLSIKEFNKKDKIDCYFIAFFRDNAVANRTQLFNNIYATINSFLSIKTFAITRGNCRFCGKSGHQHNNSSCSNGGSDPMLAIWPMRPCRLTVMDGTSGQPVPTPFTTIPTGTIPLFYDAQRNNITNGLFCFLIKVEPL